MIYLKSSKDIELIKQACNIWKKVKTALISATKPGITTKALDELANKIIVENKATPAFYQYNGFPGYICISVNDVLLHGIGSDYKLQAGDLVSYDIGVNYEKRICDAAFSLIVPGKDNEKAARILAATEEALLSTIAICKPGVTTGDLGYNINAIASKYHYDVIKDFSGHGCGIKLHEDPMIFCFGKKDHGTKLVKNMVICIEPMLMSGSDKYYIDKKDGWTVYAKNHQLTCHCEHMILITENGFEILTN